MAMFLLAFIKLQDGNTCLVSINTDMPVEIQILYYSKGKMIFVVVVVHLHRGNMT